LILFHQGKRMAKLNNILSDTFGAQKYPKGLQSFERKFFFRDLEAAEENRCQSKPLY